MKILHISKYYPPYRGGVEDICCSIVETLSGEEQKVICFNDSNKDDVSINKGVEIIRVACPKEIARQPISLRYYFKLKHVLESFDPDIIHFHLPNPLICLYLLKLINKRTKLVIHWHSDIVAQKNIYRLIAPIETKILKRADRILVTSPQYLEDSRPLKSYKNKCQVLANVVSLNKLALDNQSKDKILKIRDAYNNKKIIFFMGRHVEYKGIRYLIEAEQFIHSDCVILIAGNGPLTNSLKESSTSDRIKFIGRISDEDIKIYMNAATLFAFPSVTKNEAFGVVLAEAMYCEAVPVCFTILGSGVNWVNVNHLTGLEVENSNSKAFGEALELLLDDEELCNNLAKNGKKRVLDMFTMNTVGKELIQIYKELLQG